MFKIGALIAAVVGGLGAFLLKIFGKSQKDAGRLEERDAQNQAHAASKERADKVLGEHRDPDAVADRLRRGDF